MSDTASETSRYLTDSQSLGDGDLYRLLSNDRRRVALRALGKMDSPTTLSKLATAVEAREGDGIGAEQADGDVQVTLHHVHLPKMADLGVIEYDNETRQIELVQLPAEPSVL